MAMTIAQMKTTLEGHSHKELVALVAEIAKACPQASDFLAVKFADEDGVAEILKRHKQKIRNEFFPQRGFGRMNLREAKKSISDFKKICRNKALEIDLMLYYVENCVEFTAEFGDISETFYNSAESVYGQIVKAVNYEGEMMYERFADRLLHAAENACQGWGFYDTMMEMHRKLNWGKHREGET